MKPWGPAEADSPKRAVPGRADAVTAPECDLGTVCPENPPQECLVHNTTDVGGSVVSGEPTASSPSPQRLQLIAVTCWWGWHRTQRRRSLTWPSGPMCSQIMAGSSR